jgi:hypothetical protein
MMRDRCIDRARDFEASTVAERYERVYDHVM